MNYIDTPYFHYEENSLKCENQSLAELAEEYGTPGNLVNGANIAGFMKVARAMMAQGLV